MIFQVNDALALVNCLGKLKGNNALFEVMIFSFCSASICCVNIVNYDFQVFESQDETRLL